MVLSSGNYKRGPMGTIGWLGTSTQMQFTYNAVFAKIISLLENIKNYINRNKNQILDFYCDGYFYFFLTICEPDLAFYGVIKSNQI